MRRGGPCREALADAAPVCRLWLVREVMARLELREMGAVRLAPEVAQVLIPVACGVSAF